MKSQLSDGVGERLVYAVKCTHLGDNLELLALANVLRLGDGSLELAEDLGVKRL